MERYIEEAHVTASGSFHTNKIFASDLRVTLDEFANIAQELDALKKSLFYGKGDNVTDDDQQTIEGALTFIHADRAKAINIIHGVIGKATEVGEMVEALLAALKHEKDLDTVNMVEEVGDGLWYDALVLQACDSNFETAMVKNIAKLRARFPNAFSEYDANNRNLEAERAILEDKGN